jgi:hypothetical protein
MAMTDTSCWRMSGFFFSQEILDIHMNVNESNVLRHSLQSQVIVTTLAIVKI